MQYNYMHTLQICSFMTSPSHIIFSKIAIGCIEVYRLNSTCVRSACFLDGRIKLEHQDLILGWHR